VTKLADVFDKNSLANLCLGAAFPLSIILSALVGSLFLSHARKVSFLRAWLLLGTVASLLPAVPMGTSFIGSMMVIVALGVALGLGMPPLLSYFAESIPVENRGIMGGLTFFAVTASAPITLLTISSLDLTTSVILCAAWRFWSIPVLLTSRQKDEPVICCERTTKLDGILHNKTFALYFLAWFMFSMVDGLESHIMFSHEGEFGFTMNMVEPVVAAFSALVAGAFADWVGRKKVIIFGFISIGIAHAVLGITSQLWVGSWFLFFAADGFAIGLLWTMFTIVIWGEIASSGIEKHYAVGEAPYFLTQVVSLFFAPYVALISETSAFSLAAFFLFIAVIPLLYAPETLPEKKIQERQLKIYTEQALKLKQKVKYQ
jgi:MFS family permease